jgi:hypothetical protein
LSASTSFVIRSQIRIGCDNLEVGARNCAQGSV